MRHKTMRRRIEQRFNNIKSERNDTQSPVIGETLSPVNAGTQADFKSEIQSDVILSERHDSLASNIRISKNTATFLQADADSSSKEGEPI